MSRNVILYHNHCEDGFGAAWAAWRKFGNKAKYIGVVYSEPVPEGLEGKEVYIVDFCYPEEIIKKLLKITKRLVVIDHHISNAKAIKLVPEHVFEPTKHSGAYLSWKYFHPTKPMPKLLKHVEDSDLWNWKLKNSKEILSFLHSYKKDFICWNKITRDLEDPKKRRRSIEEGVAILRADQEKVDHAVEAAELVEFCGYKTLAANSFHLNSLIGAGLCKKLPPIGIIWSRRKSVIVVSLRSNGTVDVSRLAKKFGGGGHDASAAFRLKPTDKLPWKVISGKMGGHKND